MSHKRADRLNEMANRVARRAAAALPAPLKVAVYIFDPEAGAVGSATNITPEDMVHVTLAVALAAKQALREHSKDS